MLLGIKPNYQSFEMIENFDLEMTSSPPSVEQAFNSADFVQEILKDYELCVMSRELSLIGRREVLTGRGKFGIFGDGKELPQVVLAKYFKKGDWRAGYYRDQTLMFALGVSTPEQFMAQLYADTINDPFSGGRQMNAHFVTPNVDRETGKWLNHLEQYNVSSDISSTAGQMGRAVGLALASKKYREISELRTSTTFSENGNEICFVTIGDSSTSEGAFWEALNAAGVMRIPMAIFVWDDGYGISVPVEYQTTKGSISEVLKGFEMDENGDGIHIYTCKAWDYPTMVEVFEQGIERIRKTHIPALFHIQEVTQPQGHSTSGSHERYKSKERLAWEKAHDCNHVMRQWILESGFASNEALESIEIRAKARAKEAKNTAWRAYYEPIRSLAQELGNIFQSIDKQLPEKSAAVKHIFTEFGKLREPFISELTKYARQLSFLLRGSSLESVNLLHAWIDTVKSFAHSKYSTQLYSETAQSALQVPIVQAIYSEDAPVKNGYEIINAFFDKAFELNPMALAFGEDVGHIGDVNQGFMGLQDKYGIERVFDTGIREWTIVGQAIGLAMRGWRPIAEIQYLDYIYYGLTPLADDLSTLRYRSVGHQQAPCIIRTRGHRLEGIWHAGSPMGMMVNALRGIYICVPRNFVQAAGMYNTLLQSNDPGIVVESLNGYRLKERLPDNIGVYTVPLGVPEIICTGTDLTLITYGSCVRIAQEAISLLEQADISVELIDIQTLLPFDLEQVIVESLKKTNRLIVLDEDVPGGASAYILREVLEVQNGYRYLDAPPKTITAKEHRPPYGSDGDYFSKPNMEDIVEAVYALLSD